MDTRIFFFCNINLNEVECTLCVHLSLGRNFSILPCTLLYGIGRLGDRCWEQLERSPKFKDKTGETPNLKGWHIGCQGIGHSFLPLEIDLVGKWPFLNKVGFNFGLDVMVVGHMLCYNYEGFETGIINWDTLSRLS